MDHNNRTTTWTRPVAVPTSPVSSIGSRSGSISPVRQSTSPRSPAQQPRNVQRRDSSMDDESVTSTTAIALTAGNRK
jgi:hypothetical protein